MILGVFALFAFPAQGFENETESNLNDAQKFEQKMLAAKAQKAKRRKTKRISGSVAGESAGRTAPKVIAKPKHSNKKSNGVLSHTSNTSLSSGMFVK